MALVEATDQVMVQTNCGSIEEARTIARAAVAAGLAASGNIHGPITALYRWAGTLVEGEEHVLVLKTTTACLGELESLIRARHSYELPAILVLPILGGEASYLDWVGQESSGGTKA